MRTILHVDMDAFYASVEQRDHPELRGRPVVVGAAPDRLGVVATCSYEARAFGVRSAMPSREAYRRCPQAVFLPSDMPRYAAVSQQVFNILERFSPIVEPISIDEAFIDATGMQLLYGSGMEIAGQIRAAIRDELRLTASVGVAHNKFLAKLASVQAKPDGLHVMPVQQGEIVGMLAKLPTTALWGVGQVTARLLGNSGLRTVGDIQRTKLPLLEQIVGISLAAHLKALSMGHDEREVSCGESEQSISREHTFLIDCPDRLAVLEVLKELVEDVGRRVRAQGRLATLGRIKLRWSDFRTITRQAPFETAVCDDFTLRAMATRLFEAEPLVQPVRLVGFGVSGFTDTRREQLSLFDENPQNREKRERLCHTIDALRARLGENAIKRPVAPPNDAR